jgi:ribosome small subunit-dependent GTPase A
MQLAKMTGIVYKSTGSWYTVKTEQGDFLECRMKGKFRMKGIKSTNPIAVGDLVDYELEITSDTTTGTIYHIHDRKNYIVRKSVNLSTQLHIIASNIDQVFLLITISNPPTTTSFIDRFLATAEAYGIAAVLVFNKIDTLDETTLDEQLYLQHIYQEIGYTCLRVSSTQQKGLEQLKELMLGKVSMFSGHSGVGKSTLVNALEPGLHLKTTEISGQSQQGQWCVFEGKPLTDDLEESVRIARVGGQGCNGLARVHDSPPATGHHAVGLGGPGLSRARLSVRDRGLLHHRKLDPVQPGPAEGCPHGFRPLEIPAGDQ